MSALVVAAHPDDEVLGCGGTISRLAAQGEEVHILILGEGATARYDERTAADSGEVEVLQTQAQAAGKILGAASVTVHDFPDNRFDTVALLDIVKVVEGHIEGRSPAQVFFQNGGDVNIDHQRTYQAVLAATRPQPGVPVREVLAFEVVSSTEWAFGHLSPRFAPTVFYDITDHLDTKIEALRCYEEEIRLAPHARSIAGVRALAAHRGASVGVEAAEAFTLVRHLR